MRGILNAFWSPEFWVVSSWRCSLNLLVPGEEHYFRSIVTLSIIPWNWNGTS